MKILLRITFMILFLTLIIHTISSQEMDKLEIISLENIVQLEEIITIDQFPNSMKSIILNPNNTSITIVSDSKILSMNIRSNKQEEVTSLDRFVQSAVISEDSKLLGCMCSNQSPIDDFLLLDLETGEERLSLLDLAPATDIAIDAQNEFVATATGWTREGSKVQIWDIEQQNLFLELPANGWTSKISFSPDSKYVVAGFTSMAQVWDLHSLLEVFSIEQPFAISEQGAVNLKIGDVVFSPDSSQVASMSPEGFIWIWNTSSGEMLASFQDSSIVYDDTQSLYSISNAHIEYSPDGKLIATSNGQSLNIWDVSTETLIFNVENISNFMFSVDGKILMTVDTNNTVALWGIMP